VWAITVDDVAAGGTNLAVEHVPRRAQLGYSIAYRLWGQGLVTEAARAVIDWAFVTYDLAEIGATCDARNTAPGG
jgi:ribosomal-protein-alanine N-acetyltransferase